MLPTDTSAVGYNLDITTPTGSEFVQCQGNSLYIGTTVQAGVTLASVTPTFASSSLSNSISEECRAGRRLTTEQSFQLPRPREQTPQGG